MKLEDLVQGASYSFDLHGTTWVGTYQEHFEEATVTPTRPGTRKAYPNRLTGVLQVEIQCKNPKGGDIPLGFSVPLDDLKAMK